MAPSRLSPCRTSPTRCRASIPLAATGRPAGPHRGGRRRRIARLESRRGGRPATRDRALRRRPDRTAGPCSALAQALLIVWLAGSLLAEGPIPDSPRRPAAPQRSARWRPVLPPPTELATGPRAMLDASGLPDVFVGFEPLPAPPSQGADRSRGPGDRHGRRGEHAQGLGRDLRVLVVRHRIRRRVGVRRDQRPCRRWRRPPRCPRDRDRWQAPRRRPGPVRPEARRRAPATCRGHARRPLYSRPGPRSRRARRDARLPGRRTADDRPGGGHRPLPGDRPRHLRPGRVERESWSCARRSTAATAAARWSWPTAPSAASSSPRHGRPRTSATPCRRPRSPRGSLRRASHRPTPSTQAPASTDAATRAAGPPAPARPVRLAQQRLPMTSPGEPQMSDARPGSTPVPTRQAPLGRAHRRSRPGRRAGDAQGRRVHR